MDEETGQETQRAGIGATIRRHRVRQGLKQYELAERAGMLQATLSHIETGRALCTLRNLARVATGLQMPAAQLVAEWEGGGE